MVFRLARYLQFLDGLCAQKDLPRGFHLRANKRKRARIQVGLMTLWILTILLRLQAELCPPEQLGRPDLLEMQQLLQDQFRGGLLHPKGLAFFLARPQFFRRLLDVFARFHPALIRSPLLTLVGWIEPHCGGT